VAGWTLDSGPVALCPAASCDLLRADFGAGGLVDLDLRLADMTVTAWPPRAADRPPEPAITVAGLGGRLVATWSPDHGLGQVVARLGADRLEAPGQGLALKELTARLASVLPPGEGTTDFRLAFASLDSALCAGCLSPLKGGVEATLAGDEVRFAGRVTDAGENAKLTFDGRHGLAAAEGDLTLRLAPWALRPDDGQIDAVAPVLLDWIRRAGGTLLGGADIRWRGAAGRAAVDLVAQRPRFELADALSGGETVTGQADQVALSATAGWDAAGLESAGTLAIEGLTLAGFDVEMGQINGTVAFDRLWPLPPTTPPDQLVSLGYVQTVLPLQNGTLKFRLPAAGGIDVGDLSFDSLGGRVAIQGFRYRPGQRRIEVGLDVAGVELGRIFETAELSTMTGSAQIDGRIPVALEDGVLTVEAATLASRAGGRLGFLGEVPDLDLPVKVVEARSGTEALDVLRDFRFDHLGMSLTGSTAGDMELKAKLLGFNPTVYDGHLVDLDLTITGNLGNMLKAGRASYEIPDEIRKRMERFGR